jgi:flagellar biosynthesis chaperone FliJ
MNVKEAEKNLEATRRELAALENEKEALSAKLQKLEERRAQATRNLASGKGQDREIKAWENKMRPVQHHIEGLESLIPEARVKVAAAEEALNEAQARERAEAEAEARRREMEALQALVAGLPARETRIFDLFTQLVNELALIKIAEMRARGLVDPKPLFDFLFSLPARIKDRLARENWRPLIGLGFASHSWEIWPMLQPGDYPMQSGAIDPEHYVNWERNTRRGRPVG